MTLRGKPRGNSPGRPASCAAPSDDADVIMTDGTMDIDGEKRSGTEQELREKIKQELLKNRSGEEREDIEFLLKRL